MAVISVGLLILIVSYLQIKQLRNQKKKKDLYVFLGLIMIASYLSIGQLLDFYIPNPTNGLRIIFNPINTWIYRLMS